MDTGYGSVGGTAAEGQEYAEYGWSPEVQRKALALCLQDPEAYRQLGPEIFNARFISHLPLKPVAEVLYEACAANGGEPPSIEMLRQLVEERVVMLRPAMAEATRREFALVLETRLPEPLLVRRRMVEWAREVAVRQAVLQAADIAESKQMHNGGGAKMVQLIQDALAVGRGGDAALRFVKDPQRVLAMLQRKDEVRMVPTGIACLDRALGGGAESGLHMLAGLPKIGKTAFLSLISVGAARSGKCAYQVSGEVGLFSMARRTISAMTGQTREQIKGNPTQAVAAANFAFRHAGGEIIVDYQPGFTPAWVASRLRQLESEGDRVDVACLDFIDLMRTGSDKPATERRYELEDIGRSLHDLSMEVGIPVWTAKALNRKAVTKKIPTDADLAECFGLVYVVDNLFVLCGTQKELERRVNDQPKPIVRIYYADARERECKYTIGAFERDNNRNQWTHIPAYHLDEEDDTTMPGR